MSHRRDLFILIGLFGLLVVFVILGPAQSRDSPSFGGTPTTHSSAPAGALALLEWTRALGYDSRRLEFGDFEIDSATAALFLLSPSEPVSESEAAHVLDWVAQGGVLILAEDNPLFLQSDNALLDELLIEVQTYSGADSLLEQVPVLQPVFGAPPLAEFVARTRQVLAIERDDAVALAGSDDAPVLAGVQYDEGYIYISSASFPFSNEGLRTTSNANLVLNLLRRVEPGGRILFDEIHHGFVAPPSLRTFILGNAWGWALIYTLALLALYLLVSGRRFGRPVPLREEVAQRSSSEYVESMADLFQRGGKRAFVLRHFYTDFKRHLARPYGINPTTPDREFVAELARYRELDQAALRDLLANLRRDKVSEGDLLRLVKEADAMRIRR